MSITKTRPRATARSHQHPAAIAAQRLDDLRIQILLSLGGDTDGELLDQIVTAAVGAFVDSRNDPRRAAATIAPLLDRFGEQQARREVDSGDLTAAFHTARTTARRGLAIALGDPTAPDELIRLREDLAAYLIELHLHVHAGFVRTQRLRAMTPSQRRDRIGSMAFGLDQSDDIEKIAAAEGIDPRERLVAVVSISAAIPARLRAHPEALSGGSAREILVPERWCGEHLTTQLAGQAVICPAATLTEAAEAVTLARRGAGLLRDGVVTDSRLVVPGTDLLGSLLVGSNDLLTQLIIDKHLSDFESMSAMRRVTLGELALCCLESGQPIDQVAKQLDVPRQTAHSRMKAIRAILGDAFHDPTQRLELIVALRAALPRWRRQLPTPHPSGG